MKRKRKLSKTKHYDKDKEGSEIPQKPKKQNQFFHEEKVKASTNLFNKIPPPPYKSKIFANNKGSNNQSNPNNNQNYDFYSKKQKPLQSSCPTGSEAKYSSSPEIEDRSSLNLKK